MTQPSHFQKVVLFLILIVSVVSGLKITRESVLKPFVQGNALKIISGLHNFDVDLVRKVTWAAYHGGASHIDIACDVELVKAARSISKSMPICVSSIKPKDFVHAVAAGADMIEIGNFDGFYDQGIEFSADDVIDMTRETRTLLPSIPLSVTIPHTLSIVEQIKLAQQLELCGADIIQTEGKMVSMNYEGMSTQELIEKAAPTLASAHAISAAVSIPVMCASGLTDVTAPFALAAGAKGVGIGSLINKLSDKQYMLIAVSAVAAAMKRPIMKPSDMITTDIQDQRGISKVAASNSITTSTFKQNF